MKTSNIEPMREQVVVHFAGGGGSCTGIANALGRSPNHAVNHDSAALGMHRANHPGTRHHIEDVFEVDPADLIKQDGPVGLAWFSPSCVHFSKAKGGQPVDARIRGLTLVMLRWAKAGTRLMFMENVEEIRTWGSLIKLTKKGVVGWYPDPQTRGRTWQAFLDCMGDGIDPEHPDLPFFTEVLAGQVTVDEMVRGFGYRFEARELRACDYGTPTSRKRLYAVFRNDWRPIVWPNPTHADPALLQPGDTRRPWHTMAECVDWERPCPSIFLCGETAKKARCKRPLADATLARIARGIDKYVLNNARPFIVARTQHGGNRVEGIDVPADTITTAHRGGKHALVAAYVAQHNGGFNVVDGKPLDSPVSTINTTGSQQTLVAASVMAYYGTEADGQDVSEPARTVTTKSRMGLVNSELVPVMTEETRRGALRVAKFLRDYGVAFEGEFATVQGLAIVDIGLRMFTPRELFRASGFPEGYIINQAIYREPTTGMTVVRELTKEEQIRMCGNAVCPPVAEALVRSNAPDMLPAG